MSLFHFGNKNTLSLKKKSKARKNLFGNDRNTQYILLNSYQSMSLIQSMFTFSIYPSRFILYRCVLCTYSSQEMKYWFAEYTDILPPSPQDIRESIKQGKTLTFVFDKVQNMCTYCFDCTAFLVYFTMYF